MKIFGISSWYEGSRHQIHLYSHQIHHKSVYSLDVSVNVGCLMLDEKYHNIRFRVELLCNGGGITPKYSTPNGASATSDSIDINHEVIRRKIKARKVGEKSWRLDELHEKLVEEQAFSMSAYYTQNLIEPPWRIIQVRPNKGIRYQVADTIVDEGPVFVSLTMLKKSDLDKYRRNNSSYDIASMLEHNKNMGQEMNKDLSQEPNKDLSQEPNKDLSQELNKDLSQHLNKDLNKDLNQHLNKDQNQHLDQELNHHLNQDLNLDLNQDLNLDLNQDLNLDLNQDLNIDLNQDINLDLNQDLNQDLDLDLDLNLDLESDVDLNLDLDLSSSGSSKVSSPTQEDPKETVSIVNGDIVNNNMDVDSDDDVLDITVDHNEFDF